MMVFVASVGIKRTAKAFDDMRELRAYLRIKWEQGFSLCYIGVSQRDEGDLWWDLTLTPGGRIVTPGYQETVRKGGRTGVRWAVGTHIAEDYRGWPAL